jgi:hypothetical protein
MPPQIETSRPEIDESSWVYLGAHHAQSRVGSEQSFAHVLAEACERSGFAVYTSNTDVGAEHWVEALRHAELCVIDVGPRSALSGAELAMAFCSGRPLLALRFRDDPPPVALAGIIENHSAAREIVFDDATDCVAQLSQVLSDPAWQQLLRERTHVEDL